MANVDLDRVTEADLAPYLRQTAPSARSSATTRSRVNLSVNPSADEANLVSEVKALFARARDHRRPMVGRWQRNYRTLLNRYWSGERPGWMPSPSIPEVFPIIEARVGWLTDNRFRHTVTPAATSYTPVHEFFSKLSSDLEAVLDSTWHVNAEEAELTIALWDAETYGTGIVKTVWDTTLAGGLGDAVIRRVDPFTFYPDPQASDARDGNFYIEARTMSIQEMDRRWPGSARHFAEGGYTEDAPEQPTQLDDGGGRPSLHPNVGAISPVTTPRYGRPGSSRVRVTEDPGVTVLECWLREHELFDVTWTDASDERHTEVRVYDTWRVVVVAGNHVLMNEPADELWEHGGHPYDRYVPRDLGEFWGVSMVELLASPQETLNRLISAIQQNIELTGNPVWRESTRSNVSRTLLTNKPGQRLSHTETAAPPGWIDPPRLHEMMPEFLRYVLQRMETISGLSAITRGGTPQGRNAQGTIDAMQEAAFVRIRMALRQLEYTLREAGYKKASLIAENYTTPRMVAIVGGQGKRTSLALGARHFYSPTKNGATPFKFQLLVDAGAGTHTSRKVREDKAIQLYTLGAIDILTLLEMLDVPNREEIVRRVQQMTMGGLHNPPGQRERARAT